MWEKLVSTLGIQLAKELLSQFQKWILALVNKISGRISDAKRAKTQEEAQKKLDEAVQKNKDLPNDETKKERRDAFEDNINSGS